MTANAGVLLEFSAPGRPAPQGSHTPVVTPAAAGGGKGRRLVDPATGRVVTYGGAKKPRVYMKDSSEGLGAYRDAIALAARSAAARAGRREPLAHPVATLLTWWFPRPKNGRSWPDSRATGDVDKLERAVHDALTLARVIDDDARIVAGTKIMCFADAEQMAGPGMTHVKVLPVDDFLNMVSPGVLTLPNM